MVSTLADGPLRAVRDFLKLEASGGLMLVAMAALALVLSNTGASEFYRSVLDLPIEVTAGGAGLAKSLVLFVNDGLMALFFLLVGLEIKREVRDGQLSTRDQALLPAAAAVGGMAIPAVIYYLVVQGNPTLTPGWAIPAATDIAFSLGVMSLLGTRVPASLKIFLTALAIIDDLGAIVIIAIFYTADLSTVSLGVAGGCIIALIVLNRLGVTRLTPFIIVGLILWFAVLKSGVHATLAGVVLAFCIPLEGRNGASMSSPLRDLEHRLHPWVAYAILPIFAFFNAGVDLRGLSADVIFGPLSLGIALGLFVGKQIGVFVIAWGLIRFGICRMPEGATFAQLYGTAILTGIGFTMSLFIGGLAFEGGAHDAEVRIGVLMGSVISALVGYALLRLVSRPYGNSTA